MASVTDTLNILVATHSNIFYFIYARLARFIAFLFTEILQLLALKGLGRVSFPKVAHYNLKHSVG